MEHFSWTEGAKLLDLTHLVTTEIPTWDGSCGFESVNTIDYDQIFRVQHIHMDAGIGTHMDAPAHYVRHAACVGDIPLEQLFAPLCVIDVSFETQADYMISVDDVKEFEMSYGFIPKGAFVIAYTGWGRFWDEPEKYRNQDTMGRVCFPGFSPESVSLLLEKEIVGIGVDTMSPDGGDYGFPVHDLMLNAGKYIIENLANCDQLPPTGTQLIALPMKIAKGTEAPVRVIALIR